MLFLIFLYLIPKKSYSI